MLPILPKEFTWVCLFHVMFKEVNIKSALYSWEGVIYWIGFLRMRRMNKGRKEARGKRSTPDSRSPMPRLTLACALMHKFCLANSNLMPEHGVSGALV